MLQPQRMGTRNLVEIEELRARNSQGMPLSSWVPRGTWHMPARIENGKTPGRRKQRAQLCW